MSDASNGTDAAIRTVAQGVVYLRAKSQNDSEQVSQTCMGSRVRVLREENGWAWVEGDDTYRGWADARFLVPYEGEALATVTTVFAEVRETPDAASPLVVRLPMLAGVQVVGEAGAAVKVTTPGGRWTGYVAASAFVALPTVGAGEIAANAARRGRDLLGTPYLWGGSSPFGIDCSGFVQWAYRVSGLILRRDADIQRDDPRFMPVPLDAPQAGDLIFFGTGSEKITHIGMACADGTFIHSAGGSGVIVSPVNDGRYWPKVVDARRLDPARAGESVVRVRSEHEL